VIAEKRTFVREMRYRNMEVSMLRPKRTREEVVAWLNAARQRKAAWEKRIDEKFSVRAKHKKEAEESGYYDLEWA
jgi:hypothetical protein